MKRISHLRGPATWTSLACSLALASVARANDPAEDAHAPTPSHDAPAKSSGEHAAPVAHGTPKAHAAGDAHAPAGDHGAPAHGEGGAAKSKGGHGESASHGASPGHDAGKAAAHGESTAHGATGHAKTESDHGATGADSHGTDTSGDHGEAAHAPAGHGDSTGHGTPTATHAPAHGGGGHGASKPAHDSPEALLRKRRLVEADSGLLSGVLPRSRVVWKRTDKPLRLLSDVVVGPGQILEIGSGVRVSVAARDRSPMGAADWADSQLVSLIVRGGSLRIAGHSSRPVRFVPEKPGKGPRWGGIAIEDTRTRAQVDIAWIELAGALQGISFERAAGSVRHAVVAEGNVGIRTGGGSAPEILQSVVTGQQVAGFVTEKSGPLVRGCLFLGNAGSGVRFEGAGLARLENCAFWNNAGGDLVRPPAGVGGWTSRDSVIPDRFGNVRTEPVLRSSKLHAKLLAQLQDSLRKAPIWKRRLPDPPPGTGPWALSNFSPLLDRGSPLPLCRDRDGTPCDIGLWGGKD